MWFCSAYLAVDIRILTIGLVSQERKCNDAQSRAIGKDVSLSLEKLRKGQAVLREDGLGGVLKREFPKIRSILFWGPYNKDPTI